MVCFVDVESKSVVATTRLSVGAIATTIRGMGSVIRFPPAPVSHNGLGRTVHFHSHFYVDSIHARATLS